MRQVLAAPTGVQALLLRLRYILEVSQMGHETMGEFVKKELGTEAHEAFVSGAEQLRREGRAEAVAELLEQRFGPLPREARQKLQQASSDQIAHWIKRALSAACLEDVFLDSDP